MAGDERTQRQKAVKSKLKDQISRQLFDKYNEEYEAIDEALK